MGIYSNSGKMKNIPRFKEIKIIWIDKIPYMYVAVEKYDGKYWKSFKGKKQLIRTEIKNIIWLAEEIGLKSLKK